MSTAAPGRGIARTTLTQLAAGDWIRQAINLIVGGATGSGKTFVACALAHQACRQRRSVLYRRVPELVTALVRARDKGTDARLMGRLARVDLLILDDWGLQGFSAEGRRDLLEIVEARHQRKSILIASQIPVAAMARGDRRTHDRRRRTRPHRPQRLPHRPHRRVPAQAQQAASARRWERQVREPGLAAGSRGACGATPGRNTEQARRHAL